MVVGAQRTMWRVCAHALAPYACDGNGGDASSQLAQRAHACFGHMRPSISPHARGLSATTREQAAARASLVDAHAGEHVLRAAQPLGRHRARHSIILRAVHAPWRQLHASGSHACGAGACQCVVQALARASDALRALQARRTPLRTAKGSPVSLKRKRVLQPPTAAHAKRVAACARTRPSPSSRAGEPPPAAPGGEPGSAEPEAPPQSYAARGGKAPPKDVRRGHTLRVRGSRRAHSCCERPRAGKSACEAYAGCKQERARAWGAPGARRPPNARGSGLHWRSRPAARTQASA